MDNNKKKRVAFRLNDDEYKILKNKCCDDISFSEFCRQSVTGTNTIKLESEELKELVLFSRELIGHLGWIGNNLNQSVRIANYKNKSGSFSDVDFSVFCNSIEDIREKNTYILTTLLHEIERIKNKK